MNSEEDTENQRLMRKLEFLRRSNDRLGKLAAGLERDRDRWVDRCDELAQQRDLARIERDARLSAAQVKALVDEGLFS